MNSSPHQPSLRTRQWASIFSLFSFALVVAGSVPGHATAASLEKKSGIESLFNLQREILTAHTDAEANHALTEIIAQFPKMKGDRILRPGLLALYDVLNASGFKLKPTGASLLVDYTIVDLVDWMPAGPRRITLISRQTANGATTSPLESQLNLQILSLASGEVIRSELRTKNNEASFQLPGDGDIYELQTEVGEQRQSQFFILPDVVSRSVPPHAKLNWIAPKRLSISLVAGRPYNLTIVIPTTQTPIWSGVIGPGQNLTINLSPRPLQLYIGDDRTYAIGRIVVHHSNRWVQNIDPK